MKRFYALLSLVLFGLTSSAQFQKLIPEGFKASHNPSVGKAAGTYPDSSSVYQWNMDQWNIKTTKVYTYDASNRISEIMEYDATNDSFMHKYTYTYNAKDQAIYILQEAIINGTLSPYNRYITRYDAQGNRTSYFQESYLNNQWELQSGDSIAYVYDGQKRVTEMTLSQLSGPTIYPVQKLLWSDYQADNLPHNLVIQAYQSGYVNYVMLDRLTWKAGFDYIDFNPTSFYGSIWQSSSWKEVTYDTTDVVDGKIQTSYLFNIIGTTMDSSSKTEYLYDKMDLQMQELTYQYQGNSWAAASGNRDSIVYGSYDEKQKRTISYYAQADKHWIHLEQERFFYNSLSVPESINLALTIYPNPANGSTHIVLPEDNAQIQVFDMQGHEIKVNLEGNILACDGLNPGIYLIRIQSGNLVYSGKLQIQH